MPSQSTDHNRFSHNDLKALYMGAFTIIQIPLKVEFRLGEYYICICPFRHRNIDLTPLLPLSHLFASNLLLNLSSLLLQMLAYVHTCRQAGRQTDYLIERITKQFLNSSTRK